MTNPLITRVNDINVNCDITKEDLVAIAVSKHEQALYGQKEQLEKEIIGIEEAMDTIAKSRDKHIQSIAESRFKKPLKALLTNLKALGFSAATVKLEASLKKEEDEQIVATIQIIQDNSGGYVLAAMHRSERIDLDDKGREFTEQLQALSDQLARIRTEAVKIRKELSKISTMERQARATLAMNVLRKTDEGKELLENLDIQKALTGGN